MNYQLTEFPGVVRLDDNAFIPDAADSLAWREYQAWCAEGGVPLAAPQPPLADYQKQALSRIDADVDSVFRDVVGNRATEYQLAKDDAGSFKTAGYPAASVPASVQCWASAKGWSPQQAADDILATAATWLNAQQSMRANRLARKQDVSASMTNTQVDVALSSWSAYIAAMRAQLGVA